MAVIAGPRNKHLSAFSAITQYNWFKLF